MRRDVEKIAEIPGFVEIGGSKNGLERRREKERCERDSNE